MTTLLMLTFDIENFQSNLSLEVLTIILKLLKKHKLRGLFFITGYMAERLRKQPQILQMLETHEIGYHSSSHSVRPIIPEFTDTENYSDAIQNSLIRETSHINPITGEPEGEGGIKVLKETFTHRSITAFRAPGFCWTPPHLEALQKLGIKFDFSARMCGVEMSNEKRIVFRGVVFYPYPVYTDFWENPLRLMSFLLSKRAKKELLCFSSHDWTFSSSGPWDSIYWRNNPQTCSGDLTGNRLRMNRLMEFDVCLKAIRVLEQSRKIACDVFLEEKGSKPLDSREVDVARTYHFSMSWAMRYFRYAPKHVLAHFLRYFDRTLP